MKTNKKLLIIISIIFSFGVGMVVYGISNSTLYFFTPSEYKVLKNKQIGEFRLGGIVKKGSVIFKDKNINFILEDEKEEYKVIYKGILPNLFREGQGIIAQGEMKKKYFKAHTILAKHDENYIPKELKETLEKKNIWKEK